jgi:TRAP transporter TAXI family solute receptor
MERLGLLSATWVAQRGFGNEPHSINRGGKMRDRVFIAVLLSALLLVMSVSPGHAAQKKYRFMLGTAGSGGEVYVWGGGAAKVVSQFSKDVQLTAQLTAGSGENLIRIKSGTLKIGLSSNEWNWELFNGKGGLPKYEHRALFAMYKGDWHLGCRKTFAGSSIYDFKGKKFSFGPKGGGSYGMIKYALDALGLKFTDFDAKYLSVAESVAALKDGAIEGYFVGIGTPSSSFLDLATMPSGLKLISLSPEDIRKCIEKYKFLTETVIPANTYRGVDYEARGVGRWHFMVCRADFPEEAAYEIAKALTENHKDLMAVMAAAKFSTPENTIRQTVLPLHPGAEKYFREKGYLK